jgi:Uma2 family endonuclease
MPDLQFFRSKNPAAKGNRVALASGRPDLAVEIISPSSRRYDRMKKLAWYADIGVPEYWIVDPEERTLERLVLQKDKYLVAEVLGDDATLRPDSFEGMEIPLGTLWHVPRGD